jgi:glycosyltransferase involved in cell wall biosynthesis
VVLPDYGELGHDLDAAGVEVVIRPLAVIRRELASARGAASIFGRGVRGGLRLARLIRERDVSLVHSNTSVVLDGAWATSIARVPHVWHVREIYSRFGRAWPLYRRVLARAPALPCVSRATAAQFGTRGPIRVIPDGLAGEVTRTPREQARAALDLDSGAPTIAVLGRISDWKGQDQLVRALAEPPLAQASAIGLVAGDPWPGAESRLSYVQELAAELGVDSRVRFLGFRVDVGNVLGAADLVAVPSTRPDPLPGAAIEAAAAGVPVIASAHGGLPEIIRDRETGMLVPPGDPGALALAARRLIDDVGLRERLGQAAARDVRERFAPERLLDSIQSLYDELFTRRRR